MISSFAILPSKMSRALAAGLFAFTAGALPVPSLAQPQPAKPAPAEPVISSEPGATTASFGDWMVRCQRNTTAEKPTRLCEASQTMQVQGQNQPIAQVAIGRLGAGQPLQLVAVLPSNIALPGSVKVMLDEKDTTGFELAWRRCLPGACVAEAPVKDDILKRWRNGSEPGRIVFKNANSQDVTLPLSFRGLAQALDALAKEAI